MIRLLLLKVFLIPQYKDLIGKDTTKYIKQNYDERFKVIRYDLLIKRI